MLFGFPTDYYKPKLAFLPQMLKNIESGFYQRNIPSLITSERNYLMTESLRSSLLYRTDTPISINVNLRCFCFGKQGFYVLTATRLQQFHVQNLVELLSINYGRTTEFKQANSFSQIIDMRLWMNNENIIFAKKR